MKRVFVVTDHEDFGDNFRSPDTIVECCRAADANLGGKLREFHDNAGRIRWMLCAALRLAGVPAKSGRPGTVVVVEHSSLRAAKRDFSEFTSLYNKLKVNDFPLFVLVTSDVMTATYPAIEAGFRMVINRKSTAPDNFEKVFRRSVDAQIRADEDSGRARPLRLSIATLLMSVMTLICGAWWRQVSPHMFNDVDSKWVADVIGADARVNAEHFAYSIVIRNIGRYPISSISCAITRDGELASDSYVSCPSNIPHTIAPGKSCTLGLRIKKEERGSYVVWLSDFQGGSQDGPGGKRWNERIPVPIGW